MSLRLGGRREPVQVQAFVSERAAERLDVRIVGRGSQPREIHAHLVMVRPEIDDLPGALGTLAHREGGWFGRCMAHARVGHDGPKVS